jgi:aspartyl-tRNA(Asn)/glutamyl-tRNA(Gln) amidotransferase subunit B
MRNAAEAVAYLRKMHTLVRYLGICDGNMQEGSFRCDANVSVRPQGRDKLRHPHRDQEHQLLPLSSSGHPVRGRAPDRNHRGRRTRRPGDPTLRSDRDETRSMRGKEEANDYRYFPDPDLLPLVVDESFIAAVIEDMPELPDVRRARFQSEYGLSAYDAEVLTGSREQADYYEAVVATAGDAKLGANWVMGDLAAALNKGGQDIADSPVGAQALGQLIARIRDNTISGKIAKDVFAAMWAGEGDADAVIEAKGLKQITDTGAIEALVDEVLAANSAQVESYRQTDAAKQPKMLGFFVGQIMKRSQGKANPQQVNDLLRKKLG